VAESVAGSRAPSRRPDPLRPLQGLVVVTGLALAWLVVTILVTAPSAAEAHRRTAVLLAAVDSREPTVRPSGGPSRLPGGQRAAVVPWHVPAARPAAGTGDRDGAP
jgi:hypothetical protein